MWLLVVVSIQWCRCGVFLCWTPKAASPWSNGISPCDFGLLYYSGVFTDVFNVAEFKSLQLQPENHWLQDQGTGRVKMLTNIQILGLIPAPLFKSKTNPELISRFWAHVASFERPGVPLLSSGFFVQSAPLLLLVFPRVLPGTRAPDVPPLVHFQLLYLLQRGQTTTTSGCQQIKVWKYELVFPAQHQI